ncbi:MAG: DUF4350 domain-containing protein [Gammaproteobacteria bacterium]
MINDRRIIIVPLLIGIVVLIGVFGSKWFNNNFVYKDIEKHTGYSTEAKRNKFLAAEYYLHKLGHQVESDSNRARLLENSLDYQTILINNYGPKLSLTHFKKLKTWIENGGHLIITANNFEYVANEDEEDGYTDNEYMHNQLLAEYGIQARYTNFSENTPYPEEREPQQYTFNENIGIEIYFEPDKQLIDSYDLASYTLADRYGVHLLQLNIDKGKLTVLSDNMFLSNENIGDYDHSYLFSLLNKENNSASQNILLLFNNQSDSIFSLIWKNGQQACIAFIALLILFLWSLRNRFGPLKPNIIYSNRNITEHLRAIGRFSWRQDHGMHLLSHSRIECENALIARYPTLKQMSTQERLNHISDILDIEPEIVHSALYYTPTSTNEFINSSHYLQKLWIHQ